MKATDVVEANGLLLRRDSLTRSIKEVKGENWRRDREPVPYSIANSCGKHLPGEYTEAEVLGFLNKVLSDVNGRLAILGVDA